VAGCCVGGGGLANLTLGIADKGVRLGDGMRSALAAATPQRGSGAYLLQRRNIAPARSWRA